VVATLRPDVHLSVGGLPPPRSAPAVPRLIRDQALSDRVHVRSDVDDRELLRLYRGAAAFALPSLVEGFGLPVLEAMAAGVPAVTSDAAAVVEASGGASLVVPARDVRAWSDALSRVLTDPALAADLARRGSRVAAENTWQRAADRTMRLLRRLGGHRAQRRSR
jgi:glycosyltransferase involved in cell wall biosynthesis